MTETADVLQLRAALAERDRTIAELRAELARVADAGLAQANATPSQSEAEFHYQAGLLSMIGDAVVAVDANYVITAFNQGAEELYGWPAAEAIGRPVAEVCVYDMTTTREQARSALLTHDLLSGQVRVRRRDGTPIYVERRALVLRDAAGQVIGYLEVDRDVTEHQRTDEELRASRMQLQVLSRRLVDALENERRAIARELHDDAGQLLSTLVVGLGVLKKRYSGSEGALQHIAYLEELAQETLQVIHRVAVGLRPVALDRLGLVPALRQLVEMFQAQAPPQVSLVARGLEHARLGGELETTIYRIVQEALTNAARHAHASSVGVVVQKQGERIMCIVEDDGVGFDVEEALDRGRLGLLGMRERVQMLGGTLTIESSPGKGATFYAAFPHRRGA